jgi:hypothetical protein
MSLITGGYLYFSTHAQRTARQKPRYRNVSGGPFLYLTAVGQILPYLKALSDITA